MRSWTLSATDWIGSSVALAIRSLSSSVGAAAKAAASAPSIRKLRSGMPGSGRREVRHARVDRAARLGVDAGRAPGRPGGPTAVLARLDAFLLHARLARTIALAHPPGVRRRVRDGVGLADPHVRDDPDHQA